VENWGRINYGSRINENTKELSLQLRLEIQKLQEMGND
jgi:hypothetical protein